jgi:hypothetical protein
MDDLILDLRNRDRVAMDSTLWLREVWNDYLER